MKTKESGIVSQVQSFCFNDGEGIRTNVFLSGCPLRCKWCANPETWDPIPKLTVIKDKCIKCGKCAEVCPSKIACNACGKCLEVCPVSARKILGAFMTADEVIERIKKDIVYFRQSGGGVTFSGGEPTFQKDFLRTLVSRLYDIGIDMAIETSGFFSWDDVKDIFEKLDFIFVDLKIFDCQKHKLFTGQGNEVILNNIKNIGKLNKPVVVRIPLIEGINDDDANIIKTTEFVKENIKNGRIEILPYHNFGLHKYDALSIDELKIEFKTPSNEKVKAIESLIRQNGVRVADYK